MNEANIFEFWLDIEVAEAVVCTVFGRSKMPIRPMAGESISFYQDGSTPEFQLERAGGWQRCHHVSIQVDEVSHYATDAAENIQFTSVLRAVPIRVGTLADAVVVRDFLIKQPGFEVDPYEPKTLDKVQGHRS